MGGDDTAVPRCAGASGEEGGMLRVLGETIEVGYLVLVCSDDELESVAAWYG